MTKVGDTTGNRDLFENKLHFAMESGIPYLDVVELVRASQFAEDGGNNGENNRNRRRLLQEQERWGQACRLVSEAPGYVIRKLWWRDSEMAE